MTLLISAGTIVVADWEVGDGHKMHYPQLPDPYGVDVDWHVNWSLGDDWMCTENGSVDDIHFWISWYDDIPKPIPWIDVSIWSNNPAGPSGGSEPLDQLWERRIYDGQFIVAGPWTGDQEWMMPWGEIIPPPHHLYWQINIKNIDDPFEQIVGEIYWLVIKMPFYQKYVGGWKNTQNYFMDHAVWSYLPGEYWDMIDGIEFAFVITGEPPPPVPDLDCRGSLTWAYPGGSQPGGTKTGTFDVGNIGQPGSLLDWSVTAWPSWGTWTFTPPSGTGVAQGSWVPVTASVVPPSQPNQHFSGFITVTNSADSTDSCQIPVSLDTPRVRQVNPLFVILIERLLELFPILNLILNS